MTLLQARQLEQMQETKRGLTAIPEDLLINAHVRGILLAWYTLVGVVFFVAVFNSYADRLRPLLSALGINLP